MELRKNDFPVALQAYDVRDNDRENFIAEQVVNTQAEADTFMTLYAGKLIKTREVRDVEQRRIGATTVTHKRRTGFPAWAILLLVLLIALAIAWYTGWLQRVVDGNVAQ